MAEKQRRYTQNDLEDAARTVGYPGPYKRGDIRRDPSEFEDDLQRMTFPAQAEQTDLDMSELARLQGKEDKRHGNRARARVAGLVLAGTVTLAAAANYAFDRSPSFQPRGEKAEQEDAELRTIPTVDVNPDEITTPGDVMDPFAYERDQDSNRTSDS